MLLENISEKELLFMEGWFTPACMAESLFSNADNLSLFNESDFFDLWLGQVPLLSGEYILDKDPNLTEKQNFVLREGASDLYCFSARNWGKSLCGIKIDVILSLLCIDNEPMALTSADASHLRGVLNAIIDALDFHPIVNLFRKTINKSPTYLITTTNGNVLDGVNQNVHDGNNAGKQFYQKHFKKIWIEESSLETMTVYLKRIESKHSLGCVERSLGMTNFIRHSPPGKVYDDLSLRPKFMNVCSFINPDWSEKDLQNAIKKYDGEESLGFRTYVLGEITNEGEYTIDMEIVRRVCYPYKKDGSLNEKKTIKHFEIRKETFNDWKSLIVVERPSNSERIFLASDIGRTGQSEIIVLSEVNRVYHYLYNITLYNLTDKQQFEILEYLGETLSANFISLDCGAGTGASIFGRLEEVFPKENLVWYDGSRKIPIDFDKDAKGKIQFKNGKPVYRELIMAEWSVQHLTSLLYGGRIKIPIDYKLDKQLSLVISMKSGNRIIYKCRAENDHLFDAFRVFSIAQWSNEFFLVKPLKTKHRFCGGV